MSRDIAAIADNVFRQCCDEEGEGASVQRIVNFFKAHRDSEQWRLCNEEVDLLSDVLDPYNTCLNVNLAMLEAGLQKWVRYIEVKSCDDEVSSEVIEECALRDRCVYSASASDDPGEFGATSGSGPDSGKPLSGGFRQMDTEAMESNFVDEDYPAETPLEDTGGGRTEIGGSSSEWSSDIADILSRLHQARHQNNILLEENRKLQSQLDVTEENLLSQHTELTEWEKKNRNFQNIARENKDLQTEIEELRLRQEVLERKRKELQLTQVKAERDVQYWQDRAEEYAKMQSKLQQELDKHNSLVDEMKNSLTNYKATIEDCHRSNRSQQALIDNKDKTITTMSEAVERLQEKTEALTREKEEREGELQKMKKEMRKIRLSWSEDRRFRAANTDISIHTDGPMCSTPQRSESLQMELTEELSHDDASIQLPMPFCEKPVLHERHYEFSSPSPGPDNHSDNSSLFKTTTSSKIVDLEARFCECIEQMSDNGVMKNKCLTLFRNVISRYQRMCKTLRCEVQEIREERNFLQSRYQEALQQLRDTSCMLETDIVEKMTCLEQQIKLEQLQRLEMEAQLERYKEEEEARLLEKVHVSTQALPLRMVQKAHSQRSSPHSSGRLARNHQLSYTPLLKALDLASDLLKRGPDDSTRLGSPHFTRSVDYLLPILPEFDLEFSYSFEEELHRSSGLRDLIAVSISPDLSKSGLLKKEKSLSESLGDFEVNDRSDRPSPTSNCSGLSWHEDSYVIGADKDSDEERDRRSSTTTASSVEDMAELEKMEKRASSVPVELFSNTDVAVPQEKVQQRLMETKSASPARRISMEENLHREAMEEQHDSVDSVFEEPSNNEKTPSVPLRPIPQSTNAAPASSVPSSITPANSAPANSAPTNSAPANSAVYPSLPNTTLKDMGLQTEFGQMSHPRSNWTEQEAESKFTQLSLAFRTDRQTLSERIKLHIAARDTSERNVKTEIDTIRQIASNLVGVTNFPVDVVSNIHYTCNILEQAVYRLSSRSEILGAVQQNPSSYIKKLKLLEGRLSHAVDVMVHHMDNLRILHEKESRELDKAKRTLNESRFVSTTSDHGPDSMTKRSFSNAGLQNSSPVKSLRRTSASSRKSTLSSDSHKKDPRSRFQALAMSTGIQSSVANHLHRLSIDRVNTYEASAGPSNELHSSRDHNDGVDANGSVGGHNLALTEKDVIFQKGLEQGLRTNIGRELATLREEQGALTDSLDDLMDLRSLVPSEEEDSDLTSHMDILDILISKFLLLLSFWKQELSFVRARWFAGGVALLFALVILIWGVLQVRYPSSPPS